MKHRIFRINFSLLRHLLRAEHFAQIFAENKSSQNFLVLESVFAASLNLTSWKHRKVEVVDLTAVVSHFGERNFYSETGEKILNSLEQVAERNPEFFELVADKMQLRIRSAALVKYFQREFLENYIVQKFDVEHLRVLKGASALKQNFEKSLQEFCLLPVKTFRKIMNTLLDQNFIGLICLLLREREY